MANPWSLAGKHALVCGASRGIGRATALALAELGAEVTVLARDQARLQELLPELIAAGAPRADLLVADLDKREHLAMALAGLVAKHPVHIVVHNSGGPKGGKLLAAHDDEFHQAFGRTVLAGQVLLRATVPAMTEAGFGRFVSILSTSAREPIADLGVGNTVRAAMGGWAKTHANELPPGITINNVLPGYTRTERLGELADAASSRTGKPVEAIEEGWRQLIPEGRIAEPAELGRAIAFLCSPAASYIRGQSLAVDGGRLRGW